MFRVIKGQGDNPQGAATVQDRLLNLAVYTLFFIFALFSLRYQIFLLNYREWGDESETIVTAKMMAAGWRLYSEIFNHHGPLTFLPGLLVEKIGDFGVSAHRIPIALLQIIAIVCLYKSPIVKNFLIRVVVSVAAATMILLFMPEIYGHMYKYQTIAGILLLIILSQYTLPAIFSPDALNIYRVVCGSALIASLPFLAITYLPVAALLFLSSLRSRHIGYAAAGIFLALALNVLFLGIYGSFPGFYAFHIYLNTNILPLYADAQPGARLIVRALGVLTADLTHFLSLLVVLLSATVLAMREKGFPWRTALLVAGVCSLLMRGSGFAGMPYFYALFPLLIPVFLLAENSTPQSKYVALGFILLSIIKVSLFIPGDKQRLLAKNIPSETEFSRLVQGLTNKEDRIIAYSFQNFEYLASERLPASGHFFYLPWQEKYNENPKFGVMIDACDQIRTSKPKVMLIDKWTVWNKYSWDSYGGCIQAILDDNYYQVADKPYYVRKDLAVGAENYFNESIGREVASSVSLSKENPIALKTVEIGGSGASPKKLAGLEILFETDGRVHPGTARLMLKRTTGPDLMLDFSLPDLPDNRYRHFNLPEDFYVSGKIVSLTGGGVSSRESHSEDGEVLTCMKYLYSDGTRAYTPGCPMF